LFDRKAGKIRSLKELAQAATEARVERAERLLEMEAERMAGKNPRRFRMLVDVQKGFGADRQARSSITLIPIRPRPRGERTPFLKDFISRRVSPPRVPRFQSRHTSTPFNSI
jgi:hypothetical protein